MNGDIQKRIQAQLNLPVQTAGLIIADGLRVGGLCKFDGIIIGGQFHIHGPALYETAIVEDIAQRQNIMFVPITLTVNSLIQMSGITFVCQGGKERQITGSILAVDIDYIVRDIVDRRCHIESGRTVRLQAGIYIFYHGVDLRIVFSGRDSRIVLPDSSL